MSTELVPQELLHPVTGELLPATAGNAAELWLAARALQSRARMLMTDCATVLAEESRRQGTKTLHLPAGTAQISGGPGGGLDWNMEVLERLLEAGLPEDRYNDLVVTTVTYKVDARVAKQLEAANPDYAEVIDQARLRPDVSWRVSVK